jgi:hypothetical protein
LVWSIQLKVEARKYRNQLERSRYCRTNWYGTYSWRLRPERTEIKWKSSGTAGQIGTAGKQLEIKTRKQRNADETFEVLQDYLTMHNDKKGDQKVHISVIIV